ncbi:hypothetical protein [Ulvibacter litoralis]|uniref:Lipoprotein n=1 Tax=Ulvibacter litoralis TaxID=227084 RepID=A0A1G7JRI4_9FLAO|nr:hypothetical protein [Ulvibacter litoralis]GHC65830.1 hypothetical protein GCM10008083_33730 [Ulvibacter litoralis]SDF27414.1 hypothetical protein SAMN05421855_1254 [Ulvibacter litoralis]
MKILIIYIFLVSILFSCNQKDEFDNREPFKINRNLNCDLLIQKGYTRIFGEDVILIGKRTSDTLIYYQIEYPIREIELSQTDSESDDYPSTEKPRDICDDGTVYWRNFELKLDSTRAFNFNSEIDKTMFKILPASYELGESNYIKDAYRVINLIDKDTFECSITKRNGEWIFQSSITINGK